MITFSWNSNDDLACLSLHDFPKIGWSFFFFQSGKDLKTNKQAVSCTTALQMVTRQPWHYKHTRINEDSCCWWTSKVSKAGAWMWHILFQLLNQIIRCRIHVLELAYLFQLNCIDTGSGFVEGCYCFNRSSTAEVWKFWNVDKCLT